MTRRCAFTPDDAGDLCVEGVPWRGRAPRERISSRISWEWVASLNSWSCCSPGLVSQADRAANHSASIVSWCVAIMPACARGD